MAQDQKKKIKQQIIKIAELEEIKTPSEWDKFNKWMLTCSKFKKHLNAHSLEELKQLHKQLIALQLSNFKSAQKPFNKAWWREGNKRKDLN